MLSLTSFKTQSKRIQRRSYHIDSSFQAPGRDVLPGTQYIGSPPGRFVLVADGARIWYAVLVGVRRRDKVKRMRMHHHVVNGLLHFGHVTGRALAEQWPRLFEQKFRVDKWNVCRGWLCRHADRQFREVALIGRSSVKALVWSFGVVEVEIAPNRL